jgi:FtsP/CotA-like multicopper oxidase with cupredoxin domain
VSRASSHPFSAKAQAPSELREATTTELPAPYRVDTVNVAPGERYTVLIQATEPGVWAWHCHILTHAEGDNGMFGMVTTFIVN